MMTDSQATTANEAEDDRSVTRGDTKAALTSSLGKKTLDLSRIGSVYLLPTHFEKDELHEFEVIFRDNSVDITHDINRCRVIFTSVNTERRVKLELRIRGINLDPIAETETPGSKHSKRPLSKGSPLNKASPDTLTKTVSSTAANWSSAPVRDVRTDHRTEISDNDLLQVVRKEWLTKCVEVGEAIPFGEYLILQSRAQISSNQGHATETLKRDTAHQTGQLPVTGQLVNGLPWESRRLLREGRKDRNADAMSSDLAGSSFMPAGKASNPKRKLLTESTTENEETVIPEMPDWVKQNKIYACERSSPHKSPNEGFMAQLKKIRLARTLVGDEIGVRAYSTSIASIASYPYEIVSPKEVLALPGCNDKIAALYQEYRERGRLQAADEVDRNPTLAIILNFYNIWGVGAATAREFYYDRGWRDHDDIIENGWSTLSRHQQIGLKYFDEFEKKMSRSEVEYIASVVKYHAKKLVDDSIQVAIVGGYRRGNTECSDVDLIVSHPDEEGTKFLIDNLIRELDNEGWITHTLILAETTSNRDQESLPLKSLQKTSGFDTLDKALVVWQDPNWTTRQTDLEKDPEAKNPNIHRRVDIIVAPWKVIGCAVTGWTSETTFQRDLRRYSRKTKHWKFDSSGIRDLGTGRWVDAERWQDLVHRAKTFEEAEKRVFESLELPWIPPHERNTG